MIIHLVHSKGIHSIGDSRDRDRVIEVIGVWGSLVLDLVWEGIGDR